VRKMREILVKVWQRKLSAGQAFNALEDLFSEDRYLREKMTRYYDEIIYLLEDLEHKAITVNECTEELKWILGEKGILQREKKPATN